MFPHGQVFKLKTKGSDGRLLCSWDRRDLE